MPQRTEDSQQWSPPAGLPLKLLDTVGQGRPAAQLRGPTL